jgi:hypothetical protein
MRELFVPWGRLADAGAFFYGGKPEEARAFIFIARGAIFPPSETGLIGWLGVPLEHEITRTQFSRRDIF